MPHSASNGTPAVPHRVDRRLHRVDDRLGRLQAARGVERVLGVERHLPQRARPSGARSTNASKMWVPTESTSECPSQAASTAHASVSPVASQTCVEPAVLTHHLGGSHPVLVLVPAEGRRRLLADLEPVDDVLLDHPGAHRALALLAADDAGVALEPDRVVRRPERVVGVHHPVAGDDLGKVAVAEDARALRVGVGAPLAEPVGQRAVEAGQARDLVEHAGRPASCSAAPCRRSRAAPRCGRRRARRRCGRPPWC